MKKIIRLTESDLTRIVKRVIMEQETPECQETDTNIFMDTLTKNGNNKQMSIQNTNDGFVILQKSDGTKCKTKKEGFLS